MCRIGSALLAGLLCAASAHADAIRLATFVLVLSGGNDDVPEDARALRFYVGYGSLYMGRTVAPYLHEGESATYDLTPAAAENFAAFAALLTNGQDDRISWVAEYLSTPSFYGMYWKEGPESRCGLGAPDLAGNQLDFVRITATDIHFVPHGQYCETQFKTTYEFWGTPLPEPASAALLACGVLLLRRR